MTYGRVDLWRGSFHQLSYLVVITITTVIIITIIISIIIIIIHDTGAAMLRTKGEAGTGNIVEAVRHARAVQREIRRLSSMDKDELFITAKVVRW